MDLNSLILCDFGSTHSFISINLAQNFGIQDKEKGSALSLMGAFKGQQLLVTMFTRKVYIHT